MKDKPRILIFSTSFLPFIGGDIVAVKEISDRLYQDFDFVVITARIDKNLSKQEKIGHILIHRIGFGKNFDKYLLAFFGSFMANRLYKPNQVAMVWSLMASFAGLATESYKKYHPSVPYLLTVQEGDDPEYIAKKMRLLKWRFNNIFRRADKIQAISNYLADWAKSFKPRAGVAVIPNGIDIQKFSYKPKSINYGGENTIISASRLVVKNGLGDLIKALLDIKSQVRLKIIGVGDMEAELRALARELGVSKQVEFLGKINNDRVPEFLHQAQIFCRPSLSEGLGNAFLEAMSAGLPTIGTRVGGIVDFLEDKKTGFVCEPKNPESIASAVGFILDETNREKVEEIRRNARALTEEKYNWDTIAIQFKNLFTELINGKQ